MYIDVTVRVHMGRRVSKRKGPSEARATAREARLDEFRRRVSNT